MRRAGLCCVHIQFLLTADKIQLTPRLIDGDGGAVRQIQGAQARPHGQANLFGHVRAGHNIHRIGNVARLRAEQQNIGRLVFDFRVQLGGVRGDRHDPAFGGAAWFQSS